MIGRRRALKRKRIYSKKGGEFRHENRVVLSGGGSTQKALMADNIRHFPMPELQLYPLSG